MDGRIDVLAVLRALERMPSLVINLDGEQIPRMATTNVIAAVTGMIEAARLAARFNPYGSVENAAARDAAIAALAKIGATP